MCIRVPIPPVPLHDPTLTGRPLWSRCCNFITNRLPPVATCVYLHRHVPKIRIAPQRRAMVMHRGENEKCFEAKSTRDRPRFAWAKIGY